MDSNELDSIICVVVEPSNAKKMRNTLSQLGCIDNTKKAVKYLDTVAIPITCEAFKHMGDIKPKDEAILTNFTEEPLAWVCIICRQVIQNIHTTSQDTICHCLESKCSGTLNGVTFCIANISQKNLKRKNLTPSERLEKVLTKILANKNISRNDNIKTEPPKNWEIHGDLILLPSQCYSGDVWKMMTLTDWQDILVAIGGKRLARRTGAIHRDGFRTPNVELLVGDNGWVEHIDNGIRYGFDISKCMFSSGNITEKIRVANFKCEGETVVDLYSGIGYFTLPYLVHAKAAFVHACEWNPNAVAALKRNLVVNKVRERCQVYEGDNQQTCPIGVADRVNLGLIPTSTAGWPVACKALKNTGGVLHVHGNVTTTPKTSDGSSNLMDDPVSSAADSGTIADQASRFENETCTSNSNPLLENSSCVKRETPTTSKLDSLDKTDSKRILNNRYSRQNSWKIWSQEVSEQIKELCVEIKGGDWSTRVLHIEKVKSYAPHIDHIVVDLECRPL